MTPAPLLDSVLGVRVLITGGGGFLGRHVVEQILKGGAASVAIINRTPKRFSLDGDFEKIVTYHAADVADRLAVDAIFAQVKPHAIIHTASPVSTSNAETLYKANVEGTRILLECSKKCSDTRAFIYTSSDSAMVPTQQPLSEENAVLCTTERFNNPYGLSKALADRMVQAENCKDLGTAVLRIPTLYGEHDTNFIPQLVASIRKNEHKMQIGQNQKVFEFLYVKKAAEAHVLALRALLDPASTSSVAGQAFFVSDGRPEPFFDFTRRCYAAMGYPVGQDDIRVIPLAVIQAAASTGEWAYWALTLGTKQSLLRRKSIDHLDAGACWSIEKAKQILGYDPVVDQKKAIRDTMEWASTLL